ncbi:putative secreted protein with C-terminal beta-propeller domain [Actinoplanes tereljensis]|uniref:Beta propeller domain-containing protein n=1 Tax=Paractinoplanes tereljensis TaxID=571912 RepID=A0A919NW21_9ACTN|nr:beta-propeller domain-containing protein [Actinoplanes tereljensis]GIF25001.1 hypothetical protein Ate02nite_77310 [Actinoplanes tereljensis]
MRRRILLCATILVLAGCSEAPPSPPPRKAPVLNLVAFDTCDRLLTDLRAATRLSVGPYGLPGSGSFPENAAVFGARADSAMPAAKTQAYSGTNVHEAGADEPDVVKTDGRRIVAVSRGTLRVIDPATRALTGRLDLGTGAAAQVLLSGDHALVLSARYSSSIDGRAYEMASGDAEVILVDLSGPPRIISRYRGVGRVVDARQTGSVARVVLSSTPRIDFPYATDNTDDLLRDNRQAITAAPLDAWLPSWQVITGTAISSGRVDCSAVSRPKTYSGAGMLTLLTFDLAADALTDGSPVGVVSDGDLVYGTPTSLYVANQDWQGGDSADTEIFKFALPDVGKPELAASGRVPGSLLNQYSMSEWDGRLRVATTAGSASAVRVLTDSGGKLVQTGVVDGLGKNEQIYAVRFIGPRGYVVTFRQTDPLYSLDLSDPAAPRVTGELKITGYSAHLQQVGDDLLVGVGQEASTSGVRQGMQVSLFDVSASPRRVGQHVVPQSVSDAEFDPHALLWWPATSLLVVPVKGASEGALAYRVDAGGLQLAGKISGYVNRSLVIGNDLWTLGDNEMTAYDLSTLDRIKALNF